MAETLTLIFIAPLLQLPPWLVIGTAGFLAVLSLLKTINIFSYGLLKTLIMERQSWGLNVCCGTTDGGGVNADIVQHAALPGYVALEDIYKLPFESKQFESVLSSHTIEHVEDPHRFYSELKRVGKRVTLILPPLWDVSAALKFLEHKHIFLTWRKEHRSLPRFVTLPGAAWLHRVFRQRIAD